MSDLIRVYTSDRDDNVEYDEGGGFRYEKVKIPPKLKRRMTRCSGCYNSFYNYRVNCGGKNWCYSLERDGNFKGRGTPTCWRR